VPFNVLARVAIGRRSTALPEPAHVTSILLHCPVLPWLVRCQLPLDHTGRHALCKRTREAADHFSSRRAAFAYAQKDLGLLGLAFGGETRYLGVGNAA
jgi:hypothetical protein